MIAINAAAVEAASIFLFTKCQKIHRIEIIQHIENIIKIRTKSLKVLG